MSAAAPPRLCVLQTAYLGDVVLSTALFRALKSTLPQARLSVMTTPLAAPLLTGHPDVDEVLVFDKRGRARGLRGLWRMARELSARRFDAAVCPHPSFRSGLLLALAGVPVRIGFADSSGRWFHTVRVPRDAAQHEVRRVLSLVPALGVEADLHTFTPRLAPDPALRAAVDAKLEALGVTDARPLAGVNPFSVWGTKRWLPERFAALIDRLAEEDGYRVIVLGGPDDVRDAPEVLSRCRTRPANAVGRFDLRELVLALLRLSIYVTGDSGPMHMAAALGVPLVAIFGSTVPAQGYAPYTDRAVIVEHEIGCRPCGPHGHPRCPLGHFLCMREIDVEQVHAAVRAVTGAG